MGMGAMTRLGKAADGLLFSSEADYPLKPFVWADSVPFSPLTSDSQIARFPGSGGGPEWGGGAFDPKRGYFIVNTNDMASIEQLEKKKGGYWSSTTGPDSYFID